MPAPAVQPTCVELENGNAPAAACTLANAAFLERHGLIWGYGHPDDPLRLKAQALVVTLDYGDGDNAVDITLKDGPLDRVYGDGVDPDSY